MLNSNRAVVSLGNTELLAATRAILRRACVVEADLLVHLAEIEERRLHSEMAFPTMFAFCVDELGFSEDQAWNRTNVARAARRSQRCSTRWALWSRASYRSSRQVPAAIGRHVY